MNRLAAATLLAAASPAFAQNAPAAAPAAVIAAAPDYAQDAAWLCRPGRDDACGGSLAVTAVAASGKLSVEQPKIPADPPIDCFYVYPTVSTDAAPNSDASIDDAERNVAHAQAAPFRAACRVFAPLYRQVTLSALRSTMAGTPSGDFIAAYSDVARAWADYLKRDNGGRGVILIGHSQGSRMLKGLVQREIDGKTTPVIAAYLIGTNVLVPKGADVGGDFKAMPLCRSDRATGCVVSYVSFRADVPPPASSRFGRTGEAGMAVACTDPAALGGGGGALVPMFPARSIVSTTTTPPPPTQWAKGASITTPYVTLPGMLRADCVAAGGADYLAIHTKSDPGDARIDRIPGDLVVAGQVQPDWGLHLIDMNVAMGNLVDLARSQGKAWATKR